MLPGHASALLGHQVRAAMGGWQRCVAHPAGHATWDAGNTLLVVEGLPYHGAQLVRT